MQLWSSGCFVAKRGPTLFVDTHHEKTPKPFANQVKERKVMMLIPSKRPKACRSWSERAALHVAHLNSGFGQSPSHHPWWAACQPTIQRSVRLRRIHAKLKLVLYREIAGGWDRSGILRSIINNQSVSGGEQRYGG